VREPSIFRDLLYHLGSEQVRNELRQFPRDAGSGMMAAMWPRRNVPVPISVEPSQSWLILLARVLTTVLRSPGAEACIPQEVTG